MAVNSYDSEGGADGVDSRVYQRSGSSGHKRLMKFVGEGVRSCGKHAVPCRSSVPLKVVISSETAVEEHGEDGVFGKVAKLTKKEMENRKGVR